MVESCSSSGLARVGKRGRERPAFVVDRYLPPVSENRWLRKLEEDPGHSTWYVERFRAMAAEGKDLHGEARFVDALAPRSAAILDAGCGHGRVGGRLAALGHRVVGVDLDPTLIAAAREDHPGSTWLVGDLAELDLTELDLTEFDPAELDPAELDPAAPDIPTIFDVTVCAGNVMTFLDPATRRAVLDHLRAHLVEDGRLAVGFGAGRGYEFEDFFDDAESVGLAVALRLETWDLRPFSPGSEFLVAVLTPSMP